MRIVVEEEEEESETRMNRICSPLFQLVMHQYSHVACTSTHLGRRDFCLRDKLSAPAKLNLLFHFGNEFVLGPFLIHMAFLYLCLCFPNLKKII